MLRWRLSWLALALAVVIAVLPPHQRVEAQALTWTDVTESGMTTSSGDDFGPQTIYVDPTNNSIVIAATNYHGVWRSTDYGQNFVHYNATTYMDDGKLWAGQIAPNGTYQLMGMGNGSTNCSGIACRQWMHRSTDGGLNWTPVQNLGGSCDPYSIDISPFDSTHAVATCHSDETGFYESTDSGVTWTLRTMTIGASPYVQFGLDDNTIIVTGQGDNCAPSCADGVWRGVKSGGSWTMTSVINLGHEHGSHQIYADTTNSLILLGSGNGLYTSANGGVNWTQRDGSVLNAIMCTPLWCYAGWGYPNQGSAGPNLKYASRSNPTTWTSITASGMINGPARWALLCDGTNYVLMTANWNAGIWRAVTGETCSAGGGTGPRSLRLRGRIRKDA